MERGREVKFVGLPDEEEGKNARGKKLSRVFSKRVKRKNLSKALTERVRYRVDFEVVPWNRNTERGTRRFVTEQVLSKGP